MQRRSLMAAAVACGASPFAHALVSKTMVFPRDFGAHPDMQTEWWYVTGQLQTAPAGGQASRMFGFQVTFFRSKVPGTQAMQSGLAAKQLLFAHAAITDVPGKKLLHDQRVARWNGSSQSGAAWASVQDTALRIDDWRLSRAPGQPTGAASTSRYTMQVQNADFGFELTADTTQPVLLQGQRGLSRKGPQAAQASYYYSQPQLAVSGKLALRGERFAVAGKAWLDHETSDSLLHPEAVGWDWIGMNLADGSALTAFQLRTQSGAPLWSGGSFRAARGEAYIAANGEVAFTPLRFWKSPQTGATYPVEWRVRTPADFYMVRARVDAQELDSRASTGTLYWEGLSELVDSNGRVVGSGYLEMTGYAKPIRLL